MSGANAEHVLSYPALLAYRIVSFSVSSWRQEANPSLSVGIATANVLRFLNPVLFILYSS